MDAVKVLDFEHLEKTPYRYDIDAILKEWNSLKPRLWEDMWYNGNQTCLQYSDTCNDIFTEGCGSIKRAGGRTEEDFRLMNPLYEGTIFEEIITDMCAHRTRIMTLSKRHCYSIHADTSPRLHLALETNKDALFFWPEDMVLKHIPADGYIYRTDTTRKHTFINCGSEERTHMVMCEPIGL